MLQIEKGDKVVGKINPKTFALISNDTKLRDLYARWTKEGIPVIAPPLGDTPAYIWADRLLMIKPSSESAGTVKLALEREGYTVK